MGAHGVVGDGMSGNARSLIKETCPGARGSGAGVRVPVVAMKRVTTVEPRGAGRWKQAGSMNCKTNCRECLRLSKAEPSRRAHQRFVEKPRRRNGTRRKICALSAQFRVNLLSLNPSEALSISEERPPTGKPDAGNPPVRFGGRGRVIPGSYPYPARRRFQALIQGVAAKL
jgi:hypothetical protein